MWCGHWTSRCGPASPPKGYDLPCPHHVPLVLGIIYKMHRYLHSPLTASPKCKSLLSPNIKIKFQLCLSFTMPFLRIKSSRIAIADAPTGKEPKSLTKRVKEAIPMLRRTQSMVEPFERGHISLPIPGTAMNMRGYPLASMENLVPLHIYRIKPLSSDHAMVAQRSPPEDIFEPRPSDEEEEPFIFDKILPRLLQAERLRRSTSGHFTTRQKRVQFIPFSNARRDSGNAQFPPLSPVPEENFRSKK